MGAEQAQQGRASQDSSTSSDSLVGFIIDHTYRVVDGQPKVYLFGRLENGESFLSISDYRPFFYFRASDKKKAEALVEFMKLEETELKSFIDEPVLKASVAEPRLVSDVRRLLEAEGIPCYEADVRFTQRFLMEHDILSTLRLSGPHKRGKHAPVDRIYENPEITPADKDVPLKVLSIDLEASSADPSGDLYSVSLAGRTFTAPDSATGVKAEVKKEYNEVLFISNRNTHDSAAREKVLDLKGATVIKDEKTLLEQLRERIINYDPDVITGWNLIDFDLAFLKNKCDEHQVQFSWGRTEWPNRLRIESSFFRDSKAEVPGRMVLDGIHVLKSSFINLKDYKLGTAAHEILGEEKLIGQENKMQEIIDAYEHDPQKLVDYNLKDSQLVLDIFAKKELIELTVLRSKIVGLPMERVRASIASLDSLYLRELHKIGHVAPSGAFQEKEKGITGGYVKTSTPGIYDWVIVLDFKSLYPSVMRTFNIDPLDHRPECKPLREGEQLVKAPNGTCFLNHDGILPRLLQMLWEQRDAAKKRKDMVGSQAFKILMNSFFGVMASPNCRFFSMELANAITHFAQHFIKLTIERLEKDGFQVIYGDTDSVFVNLDVKSAEEAEKIALKIQDEMNTFFSKYIMDEYDRESYLELEFEKTYKKFLMPTARGSEVGAKKRYAGLLVTKDGEKMDFTGLEFVRRDWTELSKEFQLTLLNKIFHNEPVEDYVKNFVKDLKSGKYDDLLIYRKAVRKDLDAYVKTTPPHVKAARKLVEKTGKLTSNIVEYVLTQDGPEPVGHTTSSLDYDHYLDKQVRPIADSVLCFFDTNLDELMKGTSQMTLGGF